MILSNFDAAFEPLSAKHAALSTKAQEIIRRYADGTLDHPSYAVIGTFGAGKTQFFFSIFKEALVQGLVPMYFLAEDMFAEITKSNDIYTQGDLDNLIMRRVERAQKLLCMANGPLSADEKNELKQVLCVRDSSSALFDGLLSALSDRPRAENWKVVIFIDELEVVYRELQRRVQSEGDRSPMREFFERRSVLKFVSIAPAGIYEMGNADQTRVIRLIIPAADIGYIRLHLLKHIGRANAAWWLSRGKARHLFKACQVLRDLPMELGAAEAGRIIRDELDHVGQHPTQVPAAVTDAVQASKLPFLLNLEPVHAEATRCIHVQSSTEGELADKLSEAFAVTRSTGLLFAEYFSSTINALAGADGTTYIESRELPELFALVLDHLLEYEHGNPALADHMGELLSLYERFKTKQAELYGIVGLIWSNQLAEFRLPFRVDEIRQAFPFPLMNPVVKSHEPRTITQRFEGNGTPIWRWPQDRVTCLFFASARDFEAYTQTEEFSSLSLPEGQGLLGLLPAGQMPPSDSQLVSWLKVQSKLSLTQAPQLLSDFLLSAAGEIMTAPPGDLKDHLRRFREDRSDVLLSRKAGIYADAIDEIVEAALPHLRYFCEKDPPDADHIWGSAQIGDASAAICGLALAFTDLPTEHRAILIKLRELFRGGQERRGAGDLNRLRPRGGIVSLAIDMLPRSPRGRDGADAPAVQRLQSYWSLQDRDALSQLARLLPLQQFLKLVTDENRKRLLEALWRCTRRDFRFDGSSQTLRDVLRYVRGNIVPAVDEAHALERRAKEELGVSGIDFGSDEVFVKARQGFHELAEIIEDATKQPDSAASALVEALIRFFVNSIDVTGHIRNVQTQCAKAARSIDSLKDTATNIVRNFFEFPEAMRFAGVGSESTLAEYASHELKVPGNFELDAFADEVAERQERLSQLAAQLRRLQGSLRDLRSLLEGE